MPASFPQLGDAAVGDLATLVHHHDAIRLSFHFGERVRGQEHHGALAAQFPDDLIEMLPQGRIEARGRLVQEQGARAPEQRLGQAEPLPHAFGILADPPACGLGNADPFQHRQNRRGRLPFQPRIKSERLDAGHRRVQRDVLRQIADF